MIPDPAVPNRSLRAALLGGCVYAAAVLAWAFSTGFQLAGDSWLPNLFGLGYAAFGMFLVAALPLYLLGRLSLVSPILVALWSFGNTVYLRWYVPRPHDALASYLTVWPLFVGLIALAAIAEFGVRIAFDRSLGRFGLRALL